MFVSLFKIVICQVKCRALCLCFTLKNILTYLLTYLLICHYFRLTEELSMERTGHHLHTIVFVRSTFLVVAQLRKIHCQLFNWRAYLCDRSNTTKSLQFGPGQKEYGAYVPSKQDAWAPAVWAPTV